MTTLPEEIETERFILRPPGVADAPHLFAAYTQDPEVTKYLLWTPHEDVTETEAFMQLCIEHWEKARACEGLQGTYPYVIAPREGSEHPIGMIDAYVTHPHRATLGYVLAKAHWGGGVMTEAVSALIDALFAHPQMWRVWATCDVDNTGSARVMARAGMTREGRLRRYMVHPNVSDIPRDSFVYAITRDDWMP